MSYHISIKETNTKSTTKVCECPDEDYAKLIHSFLSKVEPNKEWVLEKIGKTEHLLIYADPAQIEMAWKCQSYFLEIGVPAVVCFSEEEINSIRKIYYSHGIPHMVTVVAQTNSWATVDYDLRLSEFTEDEFETIFSCLE